MYISCRSAMLALIGVLAGLSCDGSRGTAPRDDEPDAAPVRTDSSQYGWTQDGVFWSASIDFAFRNTFGDTVYLCCSGVYPVTLEKHVAGQWVPYAERPVLGGFGPSDPVPPGAVFRDTIVVLGAEPGHNAGPDFPGADIEGEYRLVLGHVYSRQPPVYSDTADTVPVRFRYSSSFAMRKGGLPTAAAEPDTASTRIGPLSVRTTVAGTSMHPGDSVLVRVVARNVTDSPFVWRDGMVSDCPISLEIIGPGKINYYRGMGRVCTGAGGIAPRGGVLAPGDSIVGSGWWPGTTYISTASDVAGRTGPAPPGTYRAVAWVWWSLREMVWGDAATITVRAP